MADNGQVPGGDPIDLTGAVDLSSPVQQVLRQFAANMAQHQGIAVVVVGLTADGQIAAASHTPNGHVETLGLLAAGQVLLGRQMGVAK